MLIQNGTVIQDPLHCDAAFGFMESGDIDAAERVFVTYLKHHKLVPQLVNVEVNMSRVHMSGAEQVVVEWRDTEGERLWFSVLCIENQEVRRCAKCGHVQKLFTCTACGEQADSGFGPLYGFEASQH